MTVIKVFVFSDFGINTYVLYDETNNAVVIDPGCYYAQEKEQLKNYIQEQGLKLEKVLYTHCHLDHVFGANYLARTFPGLTFAAHKEEKPLVDTGQAQARLFGVAMENPPALNELIPGGSTVTFGTTSLETLHVPGHSPGSLCYVHHAQKFIIAGDVLFNGSIGRCDLPGGDLEALIRNIKNTLLALPGDYKVYPGHGGATTIAREKESNPYLQ